MRNTENTIKKPSEAVTQKPNDEERKDSSAQIDIKEGQYSDYELVQNVTENIYDSIFGMYHSQESADYLKQQSLPSHTASPITQEIGKDFAQSVLTKDLSLSANKNLPAKEKEEKENASKIEKERHHEVKLHLLKPKHMNSVVAWKAALRYFDLLSHRHRRFCCWLRVTS